LKLGLGKKIKKSIKLRKLNREKKLKKLIRILKKSTGLVRFYKPETEKTKPNRTKIEKNRAKPKKPSQTGKIKPKKT
jgi:hypothetical protein